MLQTMAPERSTSAAGRARAMAGYGVVSLEAKVATASPHELVMMLYRGLISRLRDAHEAAREGNAARRLKASERALVIVEGLDATLDIERGGSVAESLHMVYELLRARILSGEEQALAEAVASAEDIADAWSSIRPA